MVELGFCGGSNPTPPTQTHIPTDPTLPNPKYTPSPTPSPNPTLPFPTLPNPTPRQATPPHPQTISTFTLPCPALPGIGLNMEWIGMEFYHEFFKGTFSIYLQPPPTINQTDNLNPTPQVDLDPHPPDHDPSPTH